jgi:hypothetical protein
VCCTGKGGKVSRNTKKIKDRAMSEIRSPNSKFRDGTIDRCRLNNCVKHHEVARAEFHGARGTARGHSASHEANYQKKNTRNKKNLKFGEPLGAALGKWVRTMRKSKFKVTRCSAMAKFVSMLEGQGHLAHLTPFVENNLYYRWLKRIDFKAVVQRELNVTKAM